jgi:hypothetical protein
VVYYSRGLNRWFVVTLEMKSRGYDLGRIAEE